MKHLCRICCVDFEVENSFARQCPTKLVMDSGKQVEFHYVWTTFPSNQKDVESEFFFFKRFRVKFQYELGRTYVSDFQIIPSIHPFQHQLVHLFELNEIVQFRDAEHLEKKIHTYLTFS